LREGKEEKRRRGEEEKRRRGEEKRRRGEAQRRRCHAYTAACAGVMTPLGDVWSWSSRARYDETYGRPIMGHYSYAVWPTAECAPTDAIASNKECSS